MRRREFIAALGGAAVCRWWRARSSHPTLPSGCSAADRLRTMTPSFWPLRGVSLVLRPDLLCD